MASTDLSYDITGSIRKCHNDSLGGPEIGLFMDFNDFNVIFHVFIKIHEYENYISCITWYVAFWDSNPS